jgi:hypothetical protein
MGADALSDLLRAVRLSGAVFFHYELTGDWVAEAPAAKDCLAFVMPSAQHLIEYQGIRRAKRLFCLETSRRAGRRAHAMHAPGADSPPEAPR